MDCEQEQTTSFQSGFPSLTRPWHILDAGAQPPFLPLLHRPRGTADQPGGEGDGSEAQGDVALLADGSATTQDHHQI